MKGDRREELRTELIQTIEGMGYPQEFGIAVAENLGSEKTMSRMIGYLRNVKPASAEEIADEMLAVMEERNRWIRKKETEYYNNEYNEMLYYGLGTEEAEDG